MPAGVLRGAGAVRDQRRDVLRADRVGTTAMQNALSQKRVEP